MKIYIDGIIYSLQKTRGISRYFNECINNILKLDAKNEINILLYKNIKGNPPKSKNIKYNFNKKIPIPKPKRIFGYIIKPINNYIKNKYWKKFKKGIFHSTYFTTYKNLKIPQVLTVYDMIHEKFPNYFNNKNTVDFIKQKEKCINHASAIICISESVKNDILYYYNSINKDKLFVIYLGVNYNFKKILNKNLKDNFLKENDITKPFLLYVGDRGLYKNFSNFLDAYRLLNIPELNILTVGGGDFNENEKEKLKKLNIKNKIKHLGFIPDEKLIMLYNCAEAFIFPSFYEGFGIPILEAMACGTPVVASNVSSLPEVGGNAVLYFNPYDPNDMAKKIKQAISEGKNSERIKLGMERVKNFSWEKTAIETLKIYKLYE